MINFAFFETTTIAFIEEYYATSDLEDGEWLTRETALINGKPKFLAPMITVSNPVDPNTQVDEGYAVTYDDVSKLATKENTVRPMTQEELDARVLENDIAILKDSGKDITLVLVELIDYLLLNTAMEPTDFTPEVKDAYLALEAIADRIKANG